MNTKLIIWGVVGLVIVAIVFFLFFYESKPGELDEFAQCLKEQGVIFYGAFWCPHCQDQKKMFGKSQKFLPYIECSTPDGRRQTGECKEKEIEVYPTWEFSDGSREPRVLSLKHLSEKTDCQLP
ncbi:MAG TPA: hypothetical protein QGH92_02835 [Candidatus Parcubacteria bacterium]|jgi:thiol-disulfide isomerase/thioredoxin|nr:hypothetical protein [Candidatus Parcubacteria bacterium]|tara:strand:+ start:270 stop:641 length:372 start_codon:yes stop_codon:yes gene_type:complete